MADSSRRTATLGAHHDTPRRRAWNAPIGDQLRQGVMAHSGRAGEDAPPARRVAFAPSRRDPPRYLAALGRRGAGPAVVRERPRSEEHTSELQSRGHLVCRLLLEKKKKKNRYHECKHEQ